MRRTDGTADRSAVHKSVLFCQECSHVSPAGGDWYVHEGPRRAEYTCPDCGAVIEDRPTFGDGSDATDTPRSRLRMAVRALTATLNQAFALLH